MPTKKVKTTTTTVITEEIVNVGEKTQIICILDRSGSMGSIIEDAIGGFNEFLRDQKKLKDDASMTVALFDDYYEMLYDNIPLPEVENFSRSTWSPRGMTALYDAIGKTINEVKNTHSKLVKKDRPDKVLVCIVTDGLENASREHTSEQVKKMIKECEKENGWSFIYLAANQDAFDVGTSMGFSGGNTYTFTANSKGMSNISATLDSVTTYYRSSSTSDMEFAAITDNLMDNFGVNED